MLEVVVTINLENGDEITHRDCAGNPYAVGDAIGVLYPDWTSYVMTVVNKPPKRRTER